MSMTRFMLQAVAVGPKTLVGLMGWVDQQQGVPVAFCSRQLAGLFDGELMGEDLAGWDMSTE